MAVLDATELGTWDGSRSGTQSSPGARGLPSVGVGQTVGRYILEEKLGAGGMGVVFAATDPQLDRKVALKLLYRHPDERRSELGHRRLLREAQALARVNHPNVVTINDVGLHEGRVFLAMELVRGETLRTWLRSSRSPEEILAVFVAAAQGLQAAHDQSVIHRDFKPDNVMVGDDGRVRVMDFGLARSAAGTESEPSAIESEAPSSHSVSLTSALTQAGRVIGTPAYMAPEQFANAALGPATDQFALCVALWEALTNRRPFRGSSNAEIASRVLQGLPAAPPGESHLPGWLRPVLRRGLASRPVDRWPSCSALAAELERGDPHARRRPVWVGLGVLAVLGAGSLMQAQWSVAVDDCEPRTEALSDIWNPGARARIHDGIVALDPDSGPLVADRVVPRLDAVAKEWIDSQSALCRARRSGDGSMSAVVAGRADWCLQDARDRLAITIERLPSGQVLTPEVAFAVVDALPPPRACLDENVLAHRPAPALPQRDTARRIRSQLRRVEALRVAGQYEEARTLGLRMLERAEVVGWAPLVAEVHLELGRNPKFARQHDGARDEMRSAYFAAVSANATDIALEAAIELEVDLGPRAHRFEDAQTWSRNIEALLEQQPQPNSLLLTRHLAAQALIHKAQGRYEQAEQLQKQVAELRQRELGEVHPATAQALNNRANTLGDLGRNAEAASLHQRALDSRLEVFGPSNLLVAESLNNLGNALKRLGELDEARGTLERALAINVNLLGGEHPRVGMNLYNLADIDRRAERFADATGRLERALQIYEAATGPDSSYTGLVLVKVGQVALDRGDVRGALPPLQRAVAILGSAEVPPADAGEARAVLARALWEEGSDRPRALRLAEQALADYRRSERFVDDELSELDAWLAERDQQL